MLGKDKSPPVKGINTAWVRHLQGEERKNFEDIVRNSTQVLRRLKEIFHEREAEVTNTQFSLSDFDTSSWALKTAYRNGQLSILKQLKELIPF
jgi:hypothetical protein